ncbi:MAG TPA: tetratricopeptide repeat protein [Phycisphaerae bacterium]|nr:tetratricopeptide repeat protein [Phycisphaerae bacterium]
MSDARFFSARRVTILQLLILFVAAFLTFAPSISHAFIDLDDDLYVSLNPAVLHGLTAADVRWVFLGAPRNPDHINTYAGFFIPLTWLSFQVDATLAPAPPGVIAERLGPNGDMVLPAAWMYHLDNTVQHAVAACVLFWFLWRATGTRWPAFIAALLWAVHPLRVESVAWVTERKDTLAIVFGFLAFYLYTREAAGWTFFRATGTTLAFVASLLAKPMLLMFPFLLLLLDYWPLGRMRSRREASRLVLQKVHLFVIAAIFAGITVFAQREGGALELVPASAAVRVENAAISLVHYLYLDLVPVRLSLIYAYDLHPSVVGVVGAVLLLLLITAICVWQRRRFPHLLVGWLWFLIAFVPMIGLVQAGAQAYADRFTLLPSVGLFVMLAWSLPAASFLKPTLAGSAVAAALLAGLSLYRLSFWRSSVPLFRDALRTDPDDFALDYNLGLALMREHDFADAARRFARSAELNPDFPKAFSHALLAARASPAEVAVPVLRRLVAVSPQNPEAHDMLGLALTVTKHLADALPQFREAARLNPHNAMYAHHVEQAEIALATSAPATQ